jgi:hypothetical protein
MSWMQYSVAKKYFSNRGQTTKNSIKSFLTTVRKQEIMTISVQKFIDSAKKLNIEVAALEAVAKVEGGKQGIIDGRPVILFEPHVFYRELVKAKIKPIISDICYPVWGTHPYPKGQPAQYERLDRAALINRDCALKSCSWGMFQILGTNYKKTGCLNLREFVNHMYYSEDAQLDLFVNYIKHEGLDDELRHKDWAIFAQAYNGKYYYKQNYDKKLKAAYLSFA